MERRRLGDVRIVLVLRFLCLSGLCGRLFGVSLLAVATQADDHHGCDRVKENYVQHKFGPAKDVPDDPLPGSYLLGIFSSFLFLANNRQKES